MANLKQHLIKKIAQELDAGFDCYYNFKNDEIIAIPHFENYYADEEFEDAFKAELNLVKTSKDDFVKIEVLKNYESYKIMENFIELVPDADLKLKLNRVLTRNKPFMNFKNIIDYSEFRQLWFDFKNRDYEKRVERQLNSLLPE